MLARVHNRLGTLDVSDTYTDSDYVESQEEQVPKNNTKGSTARSDTFEVVPIEKCTK